MNRAKFYNWIRPGLFHGRINQKQVDGTEAILDNWEELERKDLRHLAYMLATTYWETDRTMQPIPEIGRGHNRPYGRPDPITGKTYYGRGLVQLTWKFNYATMGKRLGQDLVNHPELALDMDTAVDILFDGMENGLFTGKRLSNYITPTTTDFVNARRIINGLDRANLIADFARTYLTALKEAA